MLVLTFALQVPSLVVVLWKHPNTRVETVARGVRCCANKF